MMLSALHDYYHRLAAQGKVPPVGFSNEKIGFELVLSNEGKPISIGDLRDLSGKKPRSKLKFVPTDPDKTRTSGIYAYPLWDKTAYVFGVSAGAGKRLAEEHAAFKARQFELFGDSDDPGIKAFLAMLDAWKPQKLTTLPGYSDEVLDANFVFRIDGQSEYLHEKPVAREIWINNLEADEGMLGQCLVTGDMVALAAGHPRIKEVNGAQSSGAYLISFNISAFESYGKSTNENAAISKAAAFAYTTALNYLLRRDAHNYQRLQIGDATVVFWARAQDTARAEAAEGLFALLNNPPTDEQEAARLKTVLDGVAQGRPLASLDPELDGNTEFFVLGLAPNAARLSIRFWCVNDLEHLVRHYADHRLDLALEPSPWKGAMPGAWSLALQTAPIHGDRPKAEDVPPQLAGELMRSILTGSRYPRSLLNNIVMRFRSDGKISGVRVALCKAVLAREARLAASSTQEVPVSLDPHSTHPGYLLGRLFAELESAQREALGKEVNATIRDRYYGAASATPANVFPMLTRNVVHHFARIRKDKRENVAYSIEKKIGEIMQKLPSEFPKHLNIQNQGQFAIGYYQQKWTRQSKSQDTVEQGE
jgi:CRISPR-associated protein Csd1